ncbi:BMP family ABC transporter substrate-binding protein [Clostridia bacterium]|nr:BMP family ABC transporter substrate-binding protein [Clostridia bacterium]
MDRYHFIDYYKVLSVERNASKQEIEESYKLLAFRYKMKDILPEATDADQRKELIDKAYTILIDSKKKKEYDAIYDDVYGRLKNQETEIPKIRRRKSPQHLKSIIAFVMISMVLVLSFIAVNGIDKETEQEDPSTILAGDDGVFKVALLVPSTITDGGWSESAYQGLLQIERELNAQVIYTEVVSKEEIIEKANQYGQENYDLIIGHGYQYSEPFKDISPKYKDSIYITNGGKYINNNLTAIEFELEKVSYIAGAVAAKLTNTNILGCIGGENIPSVSKTFLGFKLGAKSINPDIQVSISYIGSWNDPRAGYEEALRMIRTGADVLYGNANATGLGVIQAADENQVYVFGQDSDQSAYSPDYLVASMFQDTPNTYMMVARSISENRFDNGERIVVGFEDEYVKLLWNNNVKQNLPESVLAIEQAIKEEFITGNLEIPGEKDM